MRYFAGNSLAAFLRSGVSITEVTTAGKYDSVYVPSAIFVPNTTDHVQTPTFSAAGTVWVRSTINISYSSLMQSGFTPMSGVTSIFRLLQATNTGIYQPQYWNGSAWTNTGATFTLASTTNYIITVKIVLNTSFELYINGAPVSNGSGWTGGPTTMTHVRLAALGTNGTWYSEVMIADYDLRDSHLKTTALDGNSAANTGGASGVFGDINETVLDEGTAVVVSTTTNKAGFSMAALTVPAGYIIAGLVVSARGRVGGSITDGKLGVRGSSGTNSSGSGLTFNGGYEPRCRILETDPDTAAKFTQAGYNAAEVYLEAV